MSIPIGTITAWSTNTAPKGWLICNGGAISRTTYINLFNVIGTTFGTGDGNSTFNLPNGKAFYGTRPLVIPDADKRYFPEINLNTHVVWGNCETGNYIRNSTNTYIIFSSDCRSFSGVGNPSSAGAKPVYPANLVADLSEVFYYIIKY